MLKLVKEGEKVETEVKEVKPKSLKDLLSKPDETEQDDIALAAALLDENGKLKVDISLPQEYELDIMAKMLLDHLGAYHQAHQAWRAARNGQDKVRTTQLFEQWNFNQAAAAIIQHEFPKAKALADEMGGLLAKAAQASRKAQAQKDKD